MQWIPARRSQMLMHLTFLRMRERAQHSFRKQKGADIHAISTSGLHLAGSISGFSAKGAQHCGNVYTVEVLDLHHLDRA
jgi:hypothetical protein